METRTVDELKGITERLKMSRAFPKAAVTPSIYASDVNTLLNRVVSAEEDRDYWKLMKVPKLLTEIDGLEGRILTLSMGGKHHYPHMCSDEHTEIGHADSGDDERCPLCRVIDAALEIQPRRLADIETQMQVSCQARATVAEREGDRRRAAKERAMFVVHKETATALRQLEKVAKGESDG